MSVKIRLRVVGGKGEKWFRIVAADSRSPRDGKFINLLGYYNPRKIDLKTKNKLFVLDMDSYNKWISCGAIPTDVIKRLVKKLSSTSD
ncbi:MAG: 30S ribosomal protein S16 [Anaplasmataceae bacterium]|nr:30S ribosomal protein S16 [Anaplasmataceae bacterium]